MVKSGGWLMLPIIFCSIVSMAIIIERLYSLRREKILPPDLVPKIWRVSREKRLDDAQLQRLKLSSSLGFVLAA